MMRLKWYGHACFLITSHDGTLIVTDPYTPDSAGYRPVTEAAHVVVISSDDDRFHCRADLIPGQPDIVDAVQVARNEGSQTAHGITFRTIQAMESPDQNAMYRFTIDGISIGHMGDMGDPLSDQHLGFFEGVDILLALTGGPPTIKLDDLKTVIDTVRPGLVIPMHFRTLRLKLTHMHWIQPFLDYFDPADVDFAFDYEVTLTTESLPDTTRVLVMSYA